MSIMYNVTNSMCVNKVHIIELVSIDMQYLQY